jgi:glycine betaine/proline transport system substrate-binding protein
MRPSFALPLVATFVATQARADCETVTFSDVGWTDITATTAVATTILEALGHETETLLLSVPVTYSSMAEGDVDVFLGNWMPTMEADIAPYRDAGRWTRPHEPDRGQVHARHQRRPAPPRHRQLRRHRRPGRGADGEIYGIEPGNDGNRLILDMIAQASFGLGEFELVEVLRAGDARPGRPRLRAREPIVFLAWEPHP